MGAAGPVQDTRIGPLSGCAYWGRHDNVHVFVLHKGGIAALAEWNDFIFIPVGVGVWAAFCLDHDACGTVKFVTLSRLHEVGLLQLRETLHSNLSPVPEDVWPASQPPVGEREGGIGGWKAEGERSKGKH